MDRSGALAERLAAMKLWRMRKQRVKPWRPTEPGRRYPTSAWRIHHPKAVLKNGLASPILDHHR
jgi:hypothetical protein